MITYHIKNSRYIFTLFICFTYLSQEKQNAINLYFHFFYQSLFFASSVSRELMSFFVCQILFVLVFCYLAPSISFYSLKRIILFGFFFSYSVIHDFFSFLCCLIFCHCRLIFLSLQKHKHLHTKRGRYKRQEVGNARVGNEASKYDLPLNKVKRKNRNGFHFSSFHPLLFTPVRLIHILAHIYTITMAEWCE